jgi:hypothetical protein
MIRLEPEFHIEDSHIGGRSPATCRWKCGDACAQPILNPSQNTYMRDVVEEALTRRSFLAASMAGLFVMSGVANISKAQAAGTLGFKPIGLSSEDRTLLADGRGDPLRRALRPQHLLCWFPQRQGLGGLLSR